MTEILTALLLWIGVGFTLVAALGLLRFPDIYMRMHAATKAGTLGMAACLLGTMVYFDDVGVRVRAMVIILFFFITAPIAGHIIGRAAHALNVELSKKTVCDEYREFMEGKRGDAAADTAGRAEQAD